MQPAETLQLLERAVLDRRCKLQHATRLNGGRINENWLVESDQGRAVFRLYPARRSPQQIEFETSLLKHLVAWGCHVPRVLSLGTQTVNAIDGRHYVWLEYLDAQPLSLEQARNLEPERLARLLNPIRDALDSYSAPYGPVFETRVFERRLPQLIAQVEAQGRSQLADDIVQLFGRFAKWGAGLRLPSSVIHADIHPGNVLCQGEKLWLIDFDDGHVGSSALDWVLPALEFSLNDDYTVDEQRFENILEALSAEKITPAEKTALPALRGLVELKFAVSLADCGEPLASNPYFHLLEKRLVKTRPQQLFPELNSPP